MCDVYRIFASPWASLLDFSDTAKVEMFEHESYGKPVSESNGFRVGKKYLNVQVAMWKEDIKSGLLLKQELLDDDTFPSWWIDKIIK